MYIRTLPNTNSHIPHFTMAVTVCYKLVLMAMTYTKTYSECHILTSQNDYPFKIKKGLYVETQIRFLFPLKIQKAFYIETEIQFHNITTTNA